MLKTLSLLFFLLLLNIDKASIVPFAIVWRHCVVVAEVVDVPGLDGQQNVLVGEMAHAVGSYQSLRFD